MDASIQQSISNMKVSVVVCTYNGQKYLREQLNSILRQTYSADEIIIQEDGYADNTWEIIQEYCENSSNIKAFHNEEGHGINNNFFSAFKRIKAGNLIAVSDQDDIWDSRKLEKQVNSIGNKLQTNSLSLSSFRLISAAPKPLSCKDPAITVKIVSIPTIP